ncbi:glycosyltransferase [Pedobacter flavus]|uniref:Glycosyltransferase n=1 Tax=Pedobacter flavus TaxID=3113906 RepID=A0ABU7H015_9SPHI|nr:glycosyltransferase [Pedobacter sp. VNH31]MEE1884666.1 glycosyltransferase [Pedobacter sp. VNH31]
MKVLHINTYDGNGGAGRACLRLNAALIDSGVDSKVLVLYKFNPSSPTKGISETFLGKIKAVFNIFSERYLSKWLSKSIGIPFSIQKFGVDISKRMEVLEADIIHIHWVNHGFLKPADLAKLEELEKPIFWTFHDSNAFTGGCHVRYTCENYYSQCGHCPVLKISGNHDASHVNWKSKELNYSKVNFKIIAPSTWMKNSVKLSSLLGTREVRVIPNTLETHIFKPYVKAEAKKILNIEPHKFVILSGFMPSKNDKHKGTQYLFDALNLLKFKSVIPLNEIELVVFGNKSNVEQPDLPIKVTFLGTINKDEHLAKCYSASDAFILPSLEDNLPNTIMESMACGTPVVAFKTGGIPDMIKHLENGYLSDYKSSDDLVEGINWIINHPDSYSLQKECRKAVLENYAEEVIAAKHLEYYRGI